MSIEKGGKRLSLDEQALARWITGGNYRKSYIVIVCPNCQDETANTAEIDFGATVWSVDRCQRCFRPFNGDEQWYEDMQFPELTI